MGEEAITNALVRVTAGREHVVCFTSGHGERDITAAGDPQGMSTLISKLEGQNYRTRTVSLLTEGGVPSDCEILVSAGPQLEWLDAERELAAAYVAGGGALVMMFDPGTAPALAADMARYGLVVGDDVVLEASPTNQMMVGDATYILLDASALSPHAITSPIKGSLMLRLGRSVTTGPAPDGVLTQTLLQTSEYGWAETTYDGSAPLQPDGDDIQGSVPLVGVAEITDASQLKIGRTSLAPAPDTPGAPEGLGALGAPAGIPEVVRENGGRVVVIGDTDFASNELVDQLSNQDLMLNTLAWLAGEEDQISIRSNEAGAGALAMNVVQGLLVWLIALLFTPGAAVVAAIATYRRRRSL